MTSLSGLLEPAGKPFQIRYVDLPRDAVSVRRRRAIEAARRVAIAAIVGAVLGAAVGFTLANQANGAALAEQNVVRTDPVRGEFRLGPGNLQPPGYVIPLDRGLGRPDRVPPEPVEWRPSLIPLNPDPGLSGPVEWRPSLIPSQGGIGLASPPSGTFPVTPPGRVPAA